MTASSPFLCLNSRMFLSLLTQSTAGSQLNGMLNGLVLHEQVLRRHQLSW